MDIILLILTTIGYYNYFLDIILLKKKLKEGFLVITIFLFFLPYYIFDILTLLEFLKYFQKTNWIELFNLIWHPLDIPNQLLKTTPSFRIQESFIILTSQIQIYCEIWSDLKLGPKGKWIEVYNKHLVIRPMIQIKLPKLPS